jgi:hypothetical protein
MTTFSGKRGESLDEWLFLLKSSFKASNIPVEKRLVIAAGYLKQGPLHTIRKFIIEDKSWDSFEQELVKLFGIKGQEHKYKDCMATINFSDFGCAEDYINKFMFYLQEVKISDSDAFYYFKRGLPEKYRLAFVGSNVRSVQEAVELLRAMAEESNRDNAKVDVKSNYANVNAQGKKWNAKPKHKSQGFSKQQSPQNQVQNAQGQNFKSNANVTCYTCKQRGHYAPNCPQKKNVKKVNMAITATNQVESNLSSHDDKVSKVFSVSMNNQKILCINGKIESCDMLMALDSGATASILSLSAAQKFNFVIRNSDHSIRTASNEVIKVCGETDYLSVEVASRTCKLKFLVLPHEEHDVLLGLDWFSLTNAGLFPSMGVVRFPGENVYLNTSEYREWDNERVEPVFLAQNEDVDSVVDKEMGWNFPDKAIEPGTSLSKLERKQFDSLLAEYKDVFASNVFDLGACTLLDFRIELLDKSPIYTPPYRASEETRKFLQKEMNVLLKAGIIRESNSEYSAPVIVIDKKDGSKRICVDYRKLNAITVTEKWPVALPNDIFEDISSSLMFSTMDLKSGITRSSWLLRA